MPGNEKNVCKLVKSLYGIKQAPKQLHEKFDCHLSHGFIHKCIYSKFTNCYSVITNIGTITKTKTKKHWMTC